MERFCKMTMQQRGEGAGGAASGAEQAEIFVNRAEWIDAESRGREENQHASAEQDAGEREIRSATAIAKRGVGGISDHWS